MFWDGYNRNPEITDQLISAISNALRAHPNQRLGQLLSNISHHAVLWEIYDEEWIELLNESC